MPEGTKHPKSYSDDERLINEIHDVHGGRLLIRFSEEYRPSDPYARKIRWEYRAWMLRIGEKLHTIALQESWEILDDGKYRLNGSVWLREIENQRTGQKLEDMLA